MAGSSSTINFKSIEPSVQDSATLTKKIGKYLIWSDTFAKRGPYWERNEWSAKDLNEFIIEVEKIDRVYYFQNLMVTYTMFARMLYRDRYLYFHVTFDFDWIRIRAPLNYGKIYMTFDAQVFLKAVIHDHDKAKEICKLMKEDGLNVEEASRFDLYEQWSWRHYGIPTLTFLCQLVIYENRNKNKPYEFMNILPYLIAKQLEQFIKVREALEDLGRVYDPEENEYRLY